MYTHAYLHFHVYLLYFRYVEEAAAAIASLFVCLCVYIYISMYFHVYLVCFRYVEEVATAIAETKMKLSDVSAAAAVCSELHVTYLPFARALLPPLLRVVGATPPPPPKPGSGVAPLVETDGERTARLARKRSALRLMCVLNIYIYIYIYTPFLVPLQRPGCAG